MKDVSAALHGALPALVLGQIDDDEAEVADIGGRTGFQHFSDISFALGGSDSGADTVASGETLEDAMCGDKAGPACYENKFAFRHIKEKIGCRKDNIGTAWR
jgi:hypothetical protein